MGRIFCNLRGGDCESNDGKKGDEAVEHVWQSGGFLDNRGLDALFGEDQWGRSPPPLYCKDALRIVFFFFETQVRNVGVLRKQRSFEDHCCAIW